MSIADVIYNSAKRYLYPKLMTLGDDLLNAGEAVAKTDIEGVFADFNPATETVYRWLSKETPKVMRSGRQILDEIHSPSMVLGRTEPGRKIIDLFTQNELSKNRFLGPRLEGLTKASRRIGEDEAERVFNALEEPQLIASLSEKAKKLRDFLKTDYDYTWNRYVLGKAGNDPTTYNKAVRLATKEKVLPEEVEALGPQGKEAYNLLKQKVENYAPHTWDREEIVDHLSKQRETFSMKYASTQDPVKQKLYRQKVVEYENSLNKLMGGDPLTYENLPKEFLFRHELVRKGAQGYKKDAVRSYRSYVYSLARKMYDEPAVKQAAELYKQLPYDQRPYAKWYLREYAGYNQRSVWDRVAGEIASFEYIRTIGFWNLRSPIVNLTQQLNTFADAGFTASVKGYARALSREPIGEKLWKASALKMEVPQALTEELHPNAGTMDRLKRITGYFFNLAETANRKHAFLTYLTKYEQELGKESPKAIKKAIDGVHKTQFMYGRVDMPKVLRSGAGRVVGQFSSFTIKQVEFLQKLLKENPLKAATWAGIMYGGNSFAGNVLGIDLSNALGFGISFGEALKAFTSMTKGDLDEAAAHGKMAFAQGSGILPSGPGPAISGAMKIGASIGAGTLGETLKQELLPVNYQRVEQIIDSIKNRSMATEAGKVPIFGKGGEMKFEQGLVRTLSELGPKSKERTTKQLEWYKQSTFDQLESKRKRIIAETIAVGNTNKAEKLIERWGVVPTRDAIYEAIQRRNLPREMRAKWQQAESRQLAREERDLTSTIEE